MIQTDDIHESFYDLFNRRFKRIDDPISGPRLYANIAIGAHLKPCRVHPKFQCVVAIKKSELDQTPAPFLNRFEKYYITHKNIYESVLKSLPAGFKLVVEAAYGKVWISVNGSGAGVQTLFQTKCMTKPFMIFYRQKSSYSAVVDHLAFMDSVKTHWIHCC